MLCYIERIFKIIRSMNMWGILDQQVCTGIQDDYLKKSCFAKEELIHKLQKKVSTRERLACMLQKRKSEQCNFSREKDIHLFSDPLYRQAVEIGDQWLLEKFHTRTLGREEYFNASKLLRLSSSDDFCDFSPLYNGLSKVKIWDKRGLVDKKDQLISDIKYDNISILNNLSSENFSKNVWFINKEGQVIWDMRCGIVSPSNFACIKVKIWDKRGLIDKEGREICEIKYDDIMHFRNGFARVRIWNKQWYLDQEGKFFDKLP